MPKAKQLKDPVVLVVSVERRQREALRRLAFEQHRSLADITRQALKAYIAKNGKNRARTKQ